MQKEIQLNESVMERFGTLKAKGRLAHAYLFVGPPEIGKGETALAIAKLINCEADQGKTFCDSCPSCIKINSGNHPDIFIIDNGYGESIKIEQIRELLSRNRVRPYLVAKKVFIIKNIENLTLESANAFLKTLEEPSADSLLLLTTSVPEKNLDTIRSRCHHVHFQPLSNTDLAAQLRKDHRLDENNAHVLAYFSRGCLRTAKKLNAERFINRKNKLIDSFILRRPGENWFKEISSDKVQTKEYLDICASWVRDALLNKAGVNDGRLIHLDRIDDLNRFGEQYTFEELNELNKSIIKTHQLLADNLNVKLPLLIIGEQLWKK